MGPKVKCIRFFNEFENTTTCFGIQLNTYTYALKNNISQCDRKLHS